MKATQKEVALAVAIGIAIKWWMRYASQLRMEANRMPKATDVIIGGAAFAGMFEAVTDEQVAQVLQAALDYGIKEIDTAPHYGLGLSEERIGKFLAQCGKQQEVKVWTKVGRLIRDRSEVGNTIHTEDVQWDNVADSDTCIFKGVSKEKVPVLDYSAEGAQASFKDSENRIGKNYIVGLRVHDCETDKLLQAAVEANGAIDGLIALKKLNGVKHIGIGVNDPCYALKVVERCHKSIDTIMIAGSWNLLDQSAYDLLCKCERYGINVHNAGIFASGLLVGGNTVRYLPAPREMVDKTRRWRNLCQRYNVKIQSVALAFAFMPRVVTKIAIGMKTVTELDENMKSLNALIPKQLWLDAKKEKLLPHYLHFRC